MFTREDTKQIKGIAILLMLMHHLYLYADRIPYGLEVATDIVIMGKELTEILGTFGGICVPLYMFLGGYGLYMKVGSNEQSDYGRNSLVSHYIKLYQVYWKVFLIFVPLGYLCFSNQPQYCADATISGRFSEFSMKTVLMNFVGIDDSIVSEWWFFGAYLFALFAGFVYLETFKKNKRIYIELANIILFHMLVNGVFSPLPWVARFEGLAENVFYVRLLMSGKWSLHLLIGIVFAKYQVFDSWYMLLVEKLGKFERIMLAIFAMGVAGGMYVFLTDSGYALIVVPIFVFASATLVNSMTILKKPLKLLGEHSTNMWLIHGFFCYYFYPFVKLVYGSNNAFVALLVLVALSLTASIMTNMIWKLIGILYGRLRRQGKV